MTCRKIHDINSREENNDRFCTNTIRHPLSNDFTVVSSSLRCDIRLASDGKLVHHRQWCHHRHWCERTSRHRGSRWTNLHQRWHRGAAALIRCSRIRSESCSGRVRYKTTAPWATSNDSKPPNSHHVRAASNSRHAFSSFSMLKPGSLAGPSIRCSLPCMARMAASSVGMTSGGITNAP